MSTPHETILFARSITDRTDAEVLDFVTTLPDLLAKSTVNDRVAHSRILHDLARRLRERTLGDNTAISTLLGDLTEDEALAAVNAGARSVYCPKCERGHEGPCTGPEPILTIEVHPGPDPATMDAIRRVRQFQQQADREGYGR